MVKPLRQVERMCGGVDRLVGEIQQVQRDMGDCDRIVSRRQFLVWAYDSFPLAGKMLVLAAAQRCGLDARKAIELCPDLKPAQTLARMISGKGATA